MPTLAAAGRAPSPGEPREPLTCQDGLAGVRELGLAGGGGGGQAAGRGGGGHGRAAPRLRLPGGGGRALFQSRAREGRPRRRHILAGRGGGGPWGRGERLCGARGSG